MNYLTEMKHSRMCLELKYCERCGGLFLRRAATDLTYCNSCLNHQQQSPHLLAEALHGRTRQRTRQGTRLRSDKLRSVPSTIAQLQGVTVGGGLAW
jgi:Zn-finger nucleic acid-binding protein